MGMVQDRGEASRDSHDISHVFPFTSLVEYILYIAKKNNLEAVGPTFARLVRLFLAILNL